MEKHTKPNWIVEQWSRDPHRLRQACDEWLNAHLDPADCPADQCPEYWALHQWMVAEGIDDRATGLDGLSIIIKN